MGFFCGESRIIINDTKREPFAQKQRHILSKRALVLHIKIGMS